MDYCMFRRNTYLDAWEASGGLKATVDNRVTTRLSIYPHSFLVLLCFFQPESCFP